MVTEIYQKIRPSPWAAAAVHLTQNVALLRKKKNILMINDVSDFVACVCFEK